MLRCSIWHLLLAVAVVAAFLAAARAAAGLAIFLVFVAVPCSSRVVIALRRRGDAASSAALAGLIAASAFQAIMGVWGALIVGWSVAYGVERATGGVNGLLNLGCGLIAAAIVLIGLADPFFWWGSAAGPTRLAKDSTIE